MLGSSSQSATGYIRPWQCTVQDYIDHSLVNIQRELKSFLEDQIYLLHFYPKISQKESQSVEPGFAQLASERFDGDNRRDDVSHHTVPLSGVNVGHCWPAKKDLTNQGEA